MVINLYVSKNYKEFYDQLKAIADSNHKSYAGCIGNAVKEYIQRANDNVEVVNKDALDKFLVNATKEELLSMSTFICHINNRIIEECQK